MRQHETKKSGTLSTPPIVSVKRHQEPSVFTPENLLREARRQKSLPQKNVPDICILDPDGDIVRWLRNEHRAERDTNWACYHTDLYTFTEQDILFGVIGCAVGASFAVLVAEELFASGCKLLISVTSAGQIVEKGEPPYFVLIEKALRDEGTSYHYLPPTDFSYISPSLLSMLSQSLQNAKQKVYVGPTWTTDAPFRETELAIEHCRNLGIMGVEMEAAALYAFAEARKKAVICLAHITNRMAQTEGDFEKGAHGGSQEALGVINFITKAWISHK
jgi:uridine phosphorylase